MTQPNVLIIMCDQLNAGVPGCYGGPVPTPHIDRLALEGARFTSAMCPTPYCSPSRASMITGVYPHTHGINYNVNRRDYPALPAPHTEQGIVESDTTTEKLLHAAGYQTRHYGKWHLLDAALTYYPDMFLEHGAYETIMAERFAAVRRGPREGWMDWYNWALPVTQTPRFEEAVATVRERWRGKPYAEFIGKIGRLDFAADETFDHMVADRAVAALEAFDERPFMLTCSFNYPHDPNVVPSPYYELFDPDALELPLNYDTLEGRFGSQWSRTIVEDLGEAGAREFLRVYYASVKLVDDQVGRILDALEKSGRGDDTLILFTADHGDMCGGHGMVWKSTDAFYEEVVRVPLVMRYPRQVRPGCFDFPCNLVDVMPTLLEFAGVRVPDYVEGMSLVPYLLGESLAEEAPPYTFSERLPCGPAHTRAGVSEQDGSYMVRGREWKYCCYADGEEMLFDLQADPGETVNLARDSQYQGAKEYLRDRLDLWLQQADRLRA